MKPDELEQWQDYFTCQVQERYGLAKEEARQMVVDWFQAHEEDTIYKKKALRNAGRTAMKTG